MTGMTDNHITRKGEAGQPTTNRAHFAAKQQSDATVTLTGTGTGTGTGTDAAAGEPFVWDNDYDNYEQVRPYFAEYQQVRDELTEAGKYPYNDSFKGRIPALAAASDSHEDTAIYMLQQMRSRDEMHQNRDAFIADGGYDVEEVIGEQRGDLATYGYYVGGTGWSVITDARVKREYGRTLVKEPRQRNWRVLSSGKALFKPAGK